jgi:two-component system, NarL family, sensor histidine kinase UhpB
MSLKLRLIFIVNFLLFVAIFIGFFSVVFTSKNAVRSEIESSVRLAQFSIQSGIQKNPELYLFQDNFLGLKDLETIRHLTIQLLDKNKNIIDENISSKESNLSPVWFQNILDLYSKDLNPQEIPLLQYGETIGSVLISPNPIYEYDEIWQQFKNGLLIAAIFFVFVNIAIYFLFEKIIAPIENLIISFHNLEQGCYKKNNESFGISELDILRVKLNQLIGKLKKNDDKIHQLNQKMISMQEHEKKEISRDLHDEIGQSLAAIQVQAATIKTMQKSKKSLNQADSIIQTTKDLMGQTRNLIKRLSLSIIDDLGLEDSLIDLYGSWIKKSGYKNSNCLISLPNHKQFSNLHKETIFRLTQEALTNINKHARPKRIDISIQENNKSIHMKFINDGIVRNNKKMNGIGLLGMAERVANLSGTMQSRKYKDLFIIKISIPL